MTKWMYCTQCRQTVILNDCGLCLRCQGAYNVVNQPDSWNNVCGKEDDRPSVPPRTRQHMRDMRDIEEDKNRL